MEGGSFSSGRVRRGGVRHRNRGTDQERSETIDRGKRKEEKKEEGKVTSLNKPTNIQHIAIVLAPSFHDPFPSFFLLLSAPTTPLHQIAPHPPPPFPPSLPPSLPPSSPLKNLKSTNSQPRSLPPLLPPLLQLLLIDYSPQHSPPLPPLCVPRPGSVSTIPLLLDLPWLREHW